MTGPVPQSVSHPTAHPLTPGFEIIGRGYRIRAGAPGFASAARRNRAQSPARHFGQLTGGKAGTGGY